jgi:flagellar basal-body rod modification protein FlgD
MQIDSSLLSPTNAYDSPLVGNAQAVSQNDATSATSGSTAAGAASGTDALGNETTFLQLLVAQIQNQDPTNPIDSTTFLTQLASFSQLEQLISINQGIEQIDGDATAAAAAGGSTGTTTTTTQSL